jgi:Uncharacterized protein conserved in bacteria
VSDHRLKAIKLDTASFPSAGAEVEHERRVAVFDLVEKNSFHPSGAEAGPYDLTLSVQDGRLVFDIVGPDFAKAHGLSLSPLHKVIKDYMAICESYYEALRGVDPSRIEAIDMGRRGLHNEGADMLKSRLDGKIDMDHETARRLFTLVTALYRR